MPHATMKTTPDPKRLHSISEYNALIERLFSEHPEEEAASLSVGGNYHATGWIQISLLHMLGVKKSDSIIDVGCGSGRAATKLEEWGFTGEYLGTDVVQRLLDYTRARTPARFKFERVNDFFLPALSETADVVLCFSVFTHLAHEETYLYLRDMHRALKPGGRVIFSFLELANKELWPIFRNYASLVERGVESEMVAFIERPGIEALAEMLGFSIDRYISGNEDVIPMLKPTPIEGGGMCHGMVRFGQSVVVLRKR